MGRTVVPFSRSRPRRVATLSVHTSPLDQPGTGDAGGMNVYVLEVSRRLAEMGVAVDVFTRATSSALPPVVEVAPGVLVRHVVAGPYEGLDKADLPAQLCAFTSEVLRVEARHEPGWYDLVHSHYWLSGQVGRVARSRWGVPLVHSAHTLAKVKNAALAEGDTPEPLARLVGEDRVAAEADRLIASTADEAAQLRTLYGARTDQVVIVPPGVDLELFRLADASAARTRLGVPPDAVLLLFVGRIQPLKAPDLLLRTVPRLLERQPGLRGRLQVAVVGGPSGSGLEQPEGLHKLAASLGIADLVRFEPPARADRLADWYRAADVTVVPSHSESFGLVALESQACGTPVVAAAVGGLPTAVQDGVSGLLVGSHSAADFAAAIDRLVSAPALRAQMAGAARRHAERFSWQRTAEGLLAGYRGALADSVRFATAVGGS
ncbi:MAG TPA: D-inositol-3-phosphate glycosyltransferase [Mycobacteriales bacterium]|nr:D-inositol-3-phosphate glycosyltransferase [Mycobacteriales bacterium]